MELTPEFGGEALAKRLGEENNASGRWVIDSPPSPDFPIYTRGNVGEVFPDVVKPFSWSLWGIPHGEPGWRQALVNLGAFDMDEFPEADMAMLSVFGGYCYLNVTASRIFGVRAPGLTPEAIDASFFGGQDGVPPYAPKDTDVSPRHEAQLLETIGWVLTTQELPQLDEMRANVLQLREDRPDLSSLSDADLLAHVRRLATDWWYPYWTRHIMATYHSMIPAGAVGEVAMAVGLPELAADILTSDRPVDSARPALALWALSRDIRADDNLRAAFERNGVSALGSRWDDFIAEFGFRGPNEWEMASIVWELDPSSPAQALAGRVRAPDSDSPATKKAARDAARKEAIAAVEARLEGNDEVLGQFRAAAQSCAVFFAARERTRTNCAQVTHEMRMAMVELGRRYIERGVFETAQDFSLLTNAEWDQAIADPDSVKALISERRAMETKLEGLVPPFIVNGVVPPLSEWEVRGAARDELAIGDHIQGQPGCAGVYEGRATVILDPSDPGGLELGDILIARHTDPSWTPIFAAVSGVVVNVGATISHAVIVARELGVPCVVSADGATDRIPNGATIRVDGGAGTVTRIG
ncbi:MAG: PEP-utilizing enzyme [Litorimonas sp.]